MSRDYTLEDLAEEAGLTGDDATGDGGPDAPPEGPAEKQRDGPTWVDRLFDRLDERGQLDQLIDAALFGPDAVGPDGPDAPARGTMEQAADAEPTATTPTATDDTDMTDDIDREKVLQILKTVYDYAPDVPGLPDDPTVSDLIQYVEENPERVDLLLKRYA